MFTKPKIFSLPMLEPWIVLAVWDARCERVEYHRIGTLGFSENSELPKGLRQGPLSGDQDGVTDGSIGRLHERFAWLRAI